MGIGFTINPVDFDVAGFRAELAALPGVVPHATKPDEYWLAGDCETKQKVRADGQAAHVPWLSLGPGRVWLGIDWHDNRYDHGAYLLDWVLSRHACTGFDSDYGSLLADNDAIRATLKLWTLVPTPSPAARRRWLAERLTTMWLSRLSIRDADITLVLAASGGVECCALHLHDGGTVTMRGFDELATTRLEHDQRLIVGLYEHLYGTITAAEWDERGLALAIDDIQLHLASSWPLGDEGWALRDLTDYPLLEAGNGGALRLLPDADARLAGAPAP